MSYLPNNTPSGDLDAFKRFVADELMRVSRSMGEPRERLSLKTLYAPPDKFGEGVIVKADGVQWNPGAGGGVYVRVSGAWVKL